MLFQNPKHNSKIETIIGPGTELEGNIHTKESVRIDGKLKGETTAESVVIGDKGVVLGDISANHVTVGGKIKGNVSSATMLEVLPKGQVLGDIRTSKLIIADGAIFEGNCQMVKSDGQIIEMNPENLSADGEAPQGGKNLKVAPGKR